MQIYNFIPIITKSWWNCTIFNFESYHNNILFFNIVWNTNCEITFFQHYMKRHAEKKHKCSKCGFGYGLERDKRVHERNCGNTYTCDICSVFYSTRENLQLHCRSKSHPFPERYNLKPKTNKHTRWVSSFLTHTRRVYCCRILRPFLACWIFGLET